MEFTIVAVRLSGLAGRASWNLFDQALSSGSNAALSVVVARQADASAFGAFSIAFTLFILLSSISRSGISQPLVILFADASDQDFLAQARRACGWALIVGASFGVPMVVLSTIFSGAMEGVLLTTGLIAAPLLLQDALRFVFVCRGQPARAALNDAAWAALFGVAVAILLSRQENRPWTFLAAWGVTGLLAAVLGLVQVAWLPDLRGAAGWAWTHRRNSAYLVGEVLSVFGAVQLALLIVAFRLGNEAAGALRGAQTLLGPLTVVTTAAVSFAIPEIVRRPNLSARKGLAAAAILSGSLVVFDATFGLSLSLLPDSAGEAALGQTWLQTKGVLVPFALYTAAIGACLGPFALIQALRRPRAAFAISLIAGPLVMLGSIVGVTYYGLRGAVFGLVAAQCFIVPVWWLIARRVACAVAGVDQAGPRTSGSPPP